MLFPDLSISSHLNRLPQLQPRHAGSSAISRYHMLCVDLSTIQLNACLVCSRVHADIHSLTPFQSASSGPSPFFRLIPSMHVPGTLVINASFNGSGRDGRRDGRWNREKEQTQDHAADANLVQSRSRQHCGYKHLRGSVNQNLR